MKLYYTFFETLLGEMIACEAFNKLCALEFVDNNTITQFLPIISAKAKLPIAQKNNFLLKRVEHEVTEYFDKKLKIFTVPLLMLGTDFQKSVWDILLTIPHGQTISYKEQSILLGNEKAIRAVSSANGKNNISIIIPCHRVIGSDGSLTGYAGGLSRKQYLLNLESEQEFLI